MVNVTTEMQNLCTPHWHVDSISVHLFPSLQGNSKLNKMAWWIHQSGLIKKERINQSLYIKTEEWWERQYRNLTELHLLPWLKKGHVNDIKEDKLLNTSETDYRSHSFIGLSRHIWWKMRYSCFHCERHASSVRFQCLCVRVSLRCDVTCKWDDLSHQITPSIVIDVKTIAGYVTKKKKKNFYFPLIFSLTIV